MVRVEKDINAIKQKLSTASEVGAKTDDIDKRVVLLESQVGSIQQFHERVGPLEAGVQGLIAGEERQNYEVMGLRRHVDALTPLELVVPSLVDMDGTVSALTTQVQLLNEEVECLKRENNSLRHKLTQLSCLAMNDVTLMMTQLEERVSSKYESQLQAHMDLVHRHTKQHDSMSHEFRHKICDVVDELSNGLPIVEGCSNEGKKTVASLCSQMCEVHECVDSTFGDLAKRLESLKVAGHRAETTLASLLALIAKVHSLEQQVTRLREVSHHSHGCDLSCSCRSSISSVRREVSEVKLDITQLFASLETMHSARDCAETCSCRVAISMVEHELLQMKGEGTLLSSSLDDLQSQVMQVELDVDSVRTKASVHTAHGPHCSINFSCCPDIARHEAELHRFGLALDELWDCLDSVVDSVGSSDQFSSLAPDLASMHSQLDAHFSLSSQSFATLQSKVAALEEVYKAWTAGDAGAEEEEDEMDDDNHDHKGVCFHTG